ncbi:hypothetical protein D3C72_1123500 [compost metagenome]
MKLSKSEAGRLGAIRSTQLANEAKQKRIDEYLQSPAHCSNCKSSLSYEKRKAKYCSRSCAAQVNNQVSPKRVPTVTIVCIGCGNTTTNPKYCSSQCGVDHRNRLSLQKILNGNGSHGQVKKYLIATNGNRCSSCDDTHKRGTRLVMELEHKNGNSSDNRLENCELLCPSCHSVTSTYKGKNRGNGRAARRQRYQDGKSY